MAAGFLQGKEGLIAEPTENAGLGETNSSFDFCLILRAFRPGWQNSDTIVSCHSAEAPIDLRIVEARLVDARLQVVGDYQARHTAEKGKHAHV
jgi:hypothetical protein